jgi:peptide/nickel transport system substrate-binding protein
LFSEPDEAKRIAGYKAVDKYIAEQGYVIPLFQYVQPMIYVSSVTIVPDESGAVLPLLAKPA